MGTKSVVGLDNIGELFQAAVPEGEGREEAKTVNKYEIVTVVAYLIGVQDDYLDRKYGSEGYSEKLKELRGNREANIIRYLCRLRTALMLHFKKTDDEILHNLGNIDRISFYDHEEINKLLFWGIPVILTNSRAEKYSEHFNRLIDEHIDACKSLFPEWVRYDYIRDLFVIPGYNKVEIMKEEFSTYQAHLNDYPFQIFIHWEPDDTAGNIINSDGRFLHILYEQHGDYFQDSSKYHDAVDHTKESIYEFIRRSRKVIITVDCENSDVYKLYGVLKNLEAQELEKISSIILYDDYHTSCGWDWLEKFIKIPVEHVEVERVTDRKSLVDIKMTAGVCEAYYREEVDSFILCSSDSDFWGLISSLPKANFLVMYEYSKCGQAIKDALLSRNIFHCSMDDFYTGNAEDLKKKVLISELKKFLPDILGRNSWELTRQIYERTKITASAQDMEQFHSKYVKSLRLKLDADGKFMIEVAE